MAEATTIARPYAEAVFKSALAKQTLQAWSDMLLLLAAVATDKSIKTINDSPTVSATQLADIYIASCNDGLNNEGSSLVKLMAENGRLDVLPQVSEMFEHLKSQQEGIREAKIVSAFALSGSQLKDLVANIELKFKHKIEAHVSVDPELIGGVIVEIGDEILDSSVRGKLEAMAVSLKS